MVATLCQTSFSSGANGTCAQVDIENQEPDPILVPYSVLEEDQNYYICGMAVDPEHRRKGIGTALMMEAEQAGRELEFQKLSLIVFE